MISLSLKVGNAFPASLNILSEICVERYQIVLSEKLIPVVRDGCPDLATQQSFVRFYRLQYVTLCPKPHQRVCTELLRNWMWTRGKYLWKRFWGSVPNMTVLSYGQNNRPLVRTTHTRVPVCCHHTWTSFLFSCFLSSFELWVQLVQTCSCWQTRGEISIMCILIRSSERHLLLVSSLGW